MSDTSDGDQNLPDFPDAPPASGDPDTAVPEAPADPDDASADDEDLGQPLNPA